LSSLAASRLRRAAATAITLACAAIAPSAAPAAGVSWMKGFSAPGTPARYNRVGVVKVGPVRSRNVLVLVPGTSAGGGYFVPLAKTVAAMVPGWQVWSVERRENLLEDHSMVNRAKAHRATALELFDYYLGYLNNPSITTHFQSIPDASVGFARQWGMRVEVEDLRRVVLSAQRLGGRVVLGGHSLGGSIATAYATWDFGGKAGARGLAGLVYIDGGSSPKPVTPEQASQSLGQLQTGSPWLSFGGIPAPLAGLFNVTGSTGALLDPNGPSIGQAWPLLPANLKPPVRVTNLGQYGYALDSKTSPRSLIAAQAHLGHLAPSGTPRGWVRAGAITSIQRYAEMFSGTGLQSVDGTAWYHPMRLTIDSGAVGDGNANSAQSILGVRATHGADVHVPIYAFGAALGGKRVLADARALARQSHVPRRQLTLVDRHTTYAHNDPAAAFPRNVFLSNLVAFLKRIR
jgi:pimeloyl-ACP methyl ester carboxylesterase